MKSYISIKIITTIIFSLILNSASVALPLEIYVEPILMLLMTGNENVKRSGKYIYIYINTFLYK